MKLGVSWAHHALPRPLVTKASSWSSTSGSVAGVAISSTSGIAARRVEKVDAAKRGFQPRQHSLSLVIDRPEVLLATMACLATRGNFVQVELPVHALGNGLDHQIAL